MRLVDFLFALRPLVLVPAWSFFLLGCAWTRWSDPRVPFPCARLAAFSLVMAGVHLVNQVVDRESDRINSKGFFLQRGIFTPRQYVTAAGICLAAGVGGAAWRHDAPVWMLAAALLGLAYSVPPLRCAARPGFDVLANAAGYGAIAVALGAGDRAPGSSATVWLCTSTVLAVAAVFLHTTLLDLDGDRRTGKRTSGVAWGASATRRIALLLALACCGAALVTHWWPAIVPSFVIVILATGAAIAPQRLRSGQVCIVASAAYAVAAGITWLPFLPVLVLLVLLTRVYYRWRFDLAYPAL
jgi:4-hydroxybenzoate polyprenyltransferase